MRPATLRRWRCCGVMAASRLRATRRSYSAALVAPPVRGPCAVQSQWIHSPAGSTSLARAVAVAGCTGWPLEASPTPGSWATRSPGRALTILAASRCAAATRATRLRRLSCTAHLTTPTETRGRAFLRSESLLATRSTLFPRAGRYLGLSLLGSPLARTTSFVPACLFLKTPPRCGSPHRTAFPHTM